MPSFRYKTGKRDLAEHFYVIRWGVTYNPPKASYHGPQRPPRNSRGCLQQSCRFATRGVIVKLGGFTTVALSRYQDVCLRVGDADMRRDGNELGSPIALEHFPSYLYHRAHAPVEQLGPVNVDKYLPCAAMTWCLKFLSRTSYSS